MLLSRLASDAVLDVAYGWLCHRRRDYPADADVWSFRHHWPVEKMRIQADLLAGDFRFGVLDRITLQDGSDIDLWSARDALVLKGLTIVLSDALPVSARCTHVKGHGGAKAAVRQVLARLPDLYGSLSTLLGISAGGAPRRRRRCPQTVPWSRG